MVGVGEDGRGGKYRFNHFLDVANHPQTNEHCKRQGLVVKEDAEQTGVTLHGEARIGPPAEEVHLTYDH